MSDGKETNIIPFPIKNKRMPELASDPSEKDFTESLAINLCSHVLEQLYFYGYDVHTSFQNKNIILLLESIHSLINSCNKEHHPLQDFAEKHIEVSDTGVSFK